MEQLIILVIMLALGSLFGKKKEKPEPKQRPSEQKPVHTQMTQSEPARREPQRTNAAPANKPRTLKDLSKGLFEDIQKEFKELQQEVQPEAPQKTQAGPQTEIFYPETEVVEKRAERAARPASAPRAERQSGRGRIGRDKQSAIQDDKRILQEDLIPTTRQQVLQGIVYSEILGPPKSKR